ncbi:MAG: family 10 glycosylhydrolase [Verrucomicrobiaceae bacterium]|nr:family 10 glycosylhydrolase [Verrucomicrobiaceae bacterium]
MTRLLSTLLTLLTASCWAALPDSWLMNGDFETETSAFGAGAEIQHEVVHSGKGALRMTALPGKADVTVSTKKVIEVNQTQPEIMMAAFWVRLDAKPLRAGARGGVTIRVELADGSSVSWYGPFEMEPGEIGSWVYREARWKAPVPVKSLRPALYLQGYEGALCVDDFYLGKPRDLTPPPRETKLMTVTGKGDGAQLAFTEFKPKAQVFHLTAPDMSNLELDARIDVKKSSPVYLTSAWGSQYWTLYNATQRRVVQIHTDERIDLSATGERDVVVKMNAFSAGASHLEPGGYVFLADCPKGFLVYPTEPPRAKYLEVFKTELLSRSLGARGVAAPFSIADLSAHEWSVEARRDGKSVLVKPELIDAKKAGVPIFGPKVCASLGDKSWPLIEQTDAAGVPTGEYRWDAAPANAESANVSMKVRLAFPDGIREESVDKEVIIAPAKETKTAEPEKLALLGWGYPSMDFSTKESHGASSVDDLFADAKAAGISKLVVHARSNKETYYPSRIATPGATFGWDVMAAAAASSKKHGVPVYAGYILGIAQDVDLKVHPDWAALDSKGKPTGWYCFMNPEVRAFHAAMMTEIVTRYEVAGVAMDYVRPGSGCFCPRCAKGFETDSHRPWNTVKESDGDWIQWERDRITDYVRELRAAIRKARADAHLGGYVWARFAPDKDRAMQDWPRWLKEDLMDFVGVGQYTASAPWFRAECHAMRDIATNELGGDMSRIHPLLGLGYIHQANPSHATDADAIDHQLRAAREEGCTAAGYFAFYEMRHHIELSRSHSKLR